MNKSERLLLTGASGFLGQVFFRHLRDFYTVVTLGRNTNSDVVADLQKDVPGFSCSFQTVLHNAGKAHVVPKTEADAGLFFDINHRGTLNLLKGLEAAPSLPKQFIFISTIAVYGREEGENIAESHPLDGDSPYSKSKIMAEEAVKNWCEKQGVKHVILRLPLVAGVNPPGNLGTIEKAIRKGWYFKIMGNKARKSVVLAEDVARLIPRLDGKSGVFNLTDGIHPTFEDIEIAIEKALNKKIRLTLPHPFASNLAKIGDVLERLKLPAPLTSGKLKKMTSSLTFSDEKARRELGWNPQPAIPWMESNYLGGSFF